MRSGSFYVHLGLQIGLNFVPLARRSFSLGGAIGREIEFFCDLKWT